MIAWMSDCMNAWMHDCMNARMIACVNARMLVSCPEIGLHINVNKNQDYETQGI